MIRGESTKPQEISLDPWHKIGTSVFFVEIFSRLVDVVAMQGGLLPVTNAVIPHMNGLLDGYAGL